MDIHKNGAELGTVSNASSSSSAVPGHQKNSTWDAFMWSSKLQLPTLDPPLTTTSSSGVIPTHRRGASMPPNFEDESNGELPSVRYDDLVAGRPRLGHRSRPMFASVGGEADWSIHEKSDSTTSGEDLVSEAFRQPKDDILVAEPMHPPPPHHRRGGSNPMTLGGFDLFGSTATAAASDIFPSSVMMNGNTTGTTSSLRPSHRRSVTFQGTTSSYTTNSDIFASFLADSSKTRGNNTPPSPTSTSSSPSQQPHQSIGNNRINSYEFFFE